MTTKEDSAAPAGPANSDLSTLAAGKPSRGRKPNTWALLVLTITLCAAAAGIIRWSLDATCGNGERGQPRSADEVQQRTLLVEANTHLSAGQKATLIDTLWRWLPSPDSGRNGVAVPIRCLPVVGKQIY